jgi:hypothetical protein
MHNPTIKEHFVLTFPALFTFLYRQCIPLKHGQISTGKNSVTNQNIALFENETSGSVEDREFLNQLNYYEY